MIQLLFHAKRLSVLSRSFYPVRDFLPSSLLAVLSGCNTTRQACLCNDGASSTALAANQKVVSSQLSWHTNPFSDPVRSNNKNGGIHRYGNGNVPLKLSVLAGFSWRRRSSLGIIILKEGVLALTDARLMRKTLITYLSNVHLRSRFGKRQNIFSAVPRTGRIVRLRTTIGSGFQWTVVGLNFQFCSLGKYGNTGIWSCLKISR